MPSLMSQMQRNSLISSNGGLRCMLLALFVLFEQTAFADKLDLTVGYYQLEARTSSGKVKLSGAGRFTGSYKKSLQDQFDLIGGYSVLAPGGDTSDLGFGINLGLSYFPLSSSAGYVTSTGRTTLRSVSLLRPFANLSFHQRQYQSVQTGYAGGSLGIGAEWQPFIERYLIVELRYMTLNGPLSSRIQKVSIDMGLGIMLN